MELEKAKGRSTAPIQKERDEHAQFYYLCDKVLPENIATFIKTQLNLYTQMERTGSKKSLRYSVTFKQLALRLFFSSPAAYRLSSIFQHFLFAYSSEFTINDSKMAS